MRGPDEVMHSLATGDGAAMLADRRRALGWSQLELSIRVGVSMSQVCRWERGQALPSLLSLLAWADALGCGVAIVAPTGGPRDPAAEGEGGSKPAPPPPALDRGYFPRDGAEA